MQKKFKKLLSLALACAMMCSMGVTAFASEGIATAYLEHEDGTIENVPVNYSIEMLPSVYTKNGVERKYVMEASARATEKTADGSKIDGGVTAIVRIYWTDNALVHNELTALTGGWTENGGTVTNGRKVYAKAGSGATPTTKTYNPSSNGFGYYNIGLKDYFLSTRTIAWIKTTSGTSVQLILDLKA